MKIAHAMVSKVLRNYKSRVLVAAMFMFAILYFGIMNDSGVFDPVIDRIVRIAGNDPRRILVGTVILAACAHLDGSGATTFLIAVPALLPLYERLNIDRRLLACSVAMAAGVNNLLPWGGPTIRAATALNIPVMELYRPLIPVQLGGFVFVILVAYYLGRRERERIGFTSGNGQGSDVVGTMMPRKTMSLRLRILFAANVILTIAVIAAMITELLQPAVAFMIGVVVALMINYPHVEDQRRRIDAHAKAALLMTSILFAAGAFIGILSGSGMLKAMAESGAGMVTPAVASHIPVVLGILSMPLSLLFDPDSFYLGVLPVIAGVASEFGVPAASVAQGALLGQMSTGFPVSPLTPSTFLLVGLAGVELGEHQRFTIPYLFATSLVMTCACLICGVFPL
jgi:CitMHS family citrate-Mg2+:H+ or citrate-Ca2+:H+ symporter